jgi:predicted nucleic acid-binding protein
MSSACLDNHILIWGIRKEATPGQEPMILRAELFLKYLEKAETVVVVPSVVIGEFLVKVPAEKHQEVQAVLEKRFQIVPYDGAAAACAAKIFQEHKNSGVSRGSTSRDILKADIQILATAITRKVGRLYTHDGELAKLAEKYLPVGQMPEGLAKQPDLI